MKNIYVNSRLEPLLITVVQDNQFGERIFSQGEPWLLITPERLGTLSRRLGMADQRIFRLLGLVKRYSAHPETFCRRLGVAEAYYLPPEEYPPALCPRCDGVHYPHPEEIGRACDACREREAVAVQQRPGGGELRDLLADRRSRDKIQDAKPTEFFQGDLSPNYKFNRNRRLIRDWDKAINRILMGCSYRRVAREFDCSVGLLHRKVKERYWENN